MALTLPLEVLEALDATQRVIWPVAVPGISAFFPDLAEGPMGPDLWEN